MSAPAQGGNVASFQAQTRPIAGQERHLLRHRWIAVLAHWASTIPSRTAARRSLANTLRMNTSSTAAVSFASKAS
jgi:hypothetical protein